MDQKLHAPATLGSGSVGVGPGGTLDLNGCPLTIPSIMSLGTPVDASYGTIEDTSTSSVVTVLTIANGSYAGEIEDSIRLVKTGSSTLTLGGTWTPGGKTPYEARGQAIVALGGMNPSRTRAANAQFMKRKRVSNSSKPWNDTA